MDCWLRVCFGFRVSGARVEGLGFADFGLRGRA